MITVRTFVPADRDWAASSLSVHFGMPVVARLGALVDPLALPGLVAVASGTPVGLLTYLVSSGAVEIVTLHSDVPGGGRALMDAAAALVPSDGRLWLITTNDNTHALRFYQRWGLDLVALHYDGVTASRALKPSIPLRSKDGIPIRHELELEWRRAE